MNWIFLMCVWLVEISEIESRCIAPAVCDGKMTWIEIPDGTIESYIRILRRKFASELNYIENGLQIATKGMAETRNRLMKFRATTATPNDTTKASTPHVTRKAFDDEPAIGFTTKLSFTTPAIATLIYKEGVATLPAQMDLPLSTTTTTFATGIETSAAPDIDECLNYTDYCHVNSTCSNSPGSYSCTCLPGYEGNGTECKDIDECKDSLDDCDVNADCTNTERSYTCTCRDGFTGNGKACTDIDECSESVDDCDANAGCTNTEQSYTCTCRHGFTGNGRVCTDIDECKDSADDCDVDADCSNTNGSFTCTCRDGFVGTGKTCTDIDECKDSVDDCDINADCSNTKGSFTCTCGYGFVGNGRACTAATTTTTAPTPPPDCRDNNCFQYYDTGYYTYIIPTGGNRITFAEAERHCNDRGMVPGWPVNKTHYNDIMDFIRPKIGSGRGTVKIWIGLYIDPVTDTVTLKDGSRPPFLEWKPDTNPDYRNSRVVQYVRKDIRDEKHGMEPQKATLERNGVLCQYPYF